MLLLSTIETKMNTEDETGERGSKLEDEGARNVPAEGNKATTDQEDATEGGDDASSAPQGNSVRGVEESSTKAGSVPDSGENGTKNSAGKQIPEGERSLLDYSNRKVMVQGVNKYDNVKGVRKTVSKWMEEMNAANSDDAVPKFEYQKVKKPPKDSWMVVTLKEESMVQPFIDYINHGGITNKKGNKLFAKRPVPVNESTDRKRKSDDGDDDSRGSGRDRLSKRQRTTAPAAIQAARRPVTDDELRDAATPLWRLSYEDQIASKTRELINKSAQKIVNGIRSRFK